jgi:VanZ family protein
MLRIFYRGIFVIGLIVVITLSVMPSAPLPDMDVSDKLGHMAAYTALAVVGGMAFRGRSALWILAAALVLLGMGLEFVQEFVPGRTPSGYDMLANVVGIALGSAAVISRNLILRRRPQTLG